jgi:DsbC/DsbD-like thiol-disulfide interchange protein
MFTAAFRSFPRLIATICGKAVFLAVFLAAALPCMTAAHAADASASASPWDGDSRSAARLVGAKTRGEGAAQIFRAGVELKLAPSWKTYWRYPGDSGVPPHFEFEQSENVKSVVVLWPAPLRFSDAEGTTIGYKTSVVFPLHIEPKDRNKPVTLRLKLDYAVCERLCVPAEAKVDLTIDGKADANELAVTAAEALVPKPQAFRAAAPLSLSNAVSDNSSKPARVLIDVTAPDNADVTLFAEGPTSDWALPLPEPVADAGTPRIKRFAVVLDGIPSGASAKGAILKITAVAGGQAIETPVPLD